MTQPEEQATYQVRHGLPADAAQRLFGRPPEPDEWQPWNAPILTASLSLKDLQAIFGPGANVVELLGGEVDDDNGYPVPYSIMDFFYSSNNCGAQADLANRLLSLQGRDCIDDQEAQAWCRDHTDTTETTARKIMDFLAQYPNTPGYRMDDAQLDAAIQEHGLTLAELLRPRD